jgi:hypothetical protein
VVFKPLKTLLRRSRLSNSLWLALGLLAGIAAPCMAQSAADDALVQKFFPQRLLDEFAALYPGETPDKEVMYMPVDLNGADASNYILAVYSVGRLGGPAAVRVLRKEGDSAVVASEPAVKLYGANQSITPIDLDHSARSS